jgi:hypothetical protein
MLKIRIFLQKGLDTEIGDLPDGQISRLSGCLEV